MASESGVACKIKHEVVDVMNVYFNTADRGSLAARPSMRELNRHVISLVAKHWFDLGLELLNQEQERSLDRIERDGIANGVQWCCRKMFSEWLETSDNTATWEQLIAALKRISLNEAARSAESVVLQGRCATF